MPELSVSQTGERELIRRLACFLAPSQGQVLVGPGDDCAVVNPPPHPGREILTTDMLVEGTHFLRTRDTAWYCLGRKAVAANISDVATMGGCPASILISLGLPADLPVRCVEEIYAGMADEAALAGGALVGGDTTRSPVLVLNIAVTAWAPCHQTLPLRSCCRPGQYVYLSGAMGGSLAGLRLLTEPRYAFYRSGPGAEVLLNRHLAPAPRLRLGQTLARACEDLAMIDISDGLYNELSLLSQASGVRIVIDLDAVPVLPAVLSVMPEVASGGCDEYRLFSGEEYELLFATATPPHELCRALEDKTLPVVTPIGRVEKGEGIVLLRKGAPVFLPDRTFAHFEP